MARLSKLWKSLCLFKPLMFEEPLGRKQFNENALSTQRLGAY